MFGSTAYPTEQTTLPVSTEECSENFNETFVLTTDVPEVTSNVTTSILPSDGSNR